MRDQKRIVALSGNNDRIEIWNEERWQEYIAETEENFEELAEHMIDFGFREGTMFDISLYCCT